MEFRPLTLELLNHCTKTDFCTKCKYRIGCPIRRSFYGDHFKDDIDFEIFLQTLEIRESKNYGEALAFMGAEHIRNKFYNEKKIYPHFSYT